MTASKILNDRYFQFAKVLCNANFKGQRNTGTCMAIYDIEDGDRLMGIFANSKGLAKFLNVNEKDINLRIFTGTALKKQYKIERINLKED